MKIRKAVNLAIINTTTNMGRPESIMDMVMDMVTVMVTAITLDIMDIHVMATMEIAGATGASEAAEDMDMAMAVTTTVTNTAFKEERLHKPSEKSI